MTASTGALLVLAVVLAPVEAGAQPMLKQDAKQPVFVAGPPIGPGVDSWFRAHEAKDEHAVFRLPFTIWRRPGLRGQVTAAALGRVATPPAEPIRLQDGALGVPLVERMAHLCGEEPRCVVWLAGRFTALFMPEPASKVGSVFSVLAVHERAAAEGELRAEIERPRSCLAVRPLQPIHCARGPARCERCREAAKQPAQPRLLDLCPEGDLARPTITLARDGKRVVRVYDVLRTFADDREARAFAEAHGVDDVEL